MLLSPYNLNTIQSKSVFLWCCCENVVGLSDIYRWCNPWSDETILFPKNYILVQIQTVYRATENLSIEFLFKHKKGNL